MIFRVLLLFTIYNFANSRIVVLSPAINEIIYALDRDELIVGNTNFSLYPKGAKDKYKVGGYMPIEDLTAVLDSLK